MTKESLKIYLGLLRTFRNGPALVWALRTGSLCERAVFWDGRILQHPPGRHGLMDSLLEIWVEKVYEKSIAKPFEPGSVIFDIGANVGVWSVYVARRHPECRVVALEPFPQSFEYLRKNVEANRVRNVEMHQLALGHTEGTARMTEVSDRSLDNRLVETGTGATVRVLPISELFELAGANEITLLKIDIEGSEHDAFRDVDPGVFKRVRHIVLEYHDHIRPGTLELVKSKLERTHSIDVEGSTVPGCGMLFASANI